MLKPVIAKLIDLVPGEGATDKERQRFYWAMTVGLILAALSLAHAYNWFAPETYGFARADEVQKLVQETKEDVNTQIKELNIRFDKLQSSVDRTNLRQLRGEIRDMRKQQCQSIATRNNDAKRFAYEQMAILQDEHSRLTGEQYPVPTCDEVPE